MKVQLDKTFPMPASADHAWALMQDIEAVAGCMPGARITERIDPQHYKGTVAVRFGPANLTFRGEIEVLELDPAGRSLRLRGKGTDTTGGSAAGMDLGAHVDPVDDASCRLVGSSELSVSGKAATFGGRLMTSLADQLLQQFASNFAAQLRARQPQAVEAPPAPAAPAEQAATTAPAAQAAPPVAAAEPVPSLNGPGLLWGAFKHWLRSLFARGATPRQ
ncbi:MULTISPECIES: SRPBCC family protein [Ramlibacter]|uniref:Carbon monoxide dehydrogenase n=1 Tax=Ramlibacter pinisoli TaxID=2682844 RepID=A0A6N8IXC1_9BURK|nr:MULTISPECIES: SRPBCC family protein [Ramlibacter]MBA2961706.1 SRPBCC family protein [Ramlibacter sp. CGMCC 1.13660]MVQ31649.1 carbon monoxide dehydrogenase [Ramlibacter pinisoli]